MMIIKKTNYYSSNVGKIQNWRQNLHLFICTTHLRKKNKVYNSFYKVQMCRINDLYPSPTNLSPGITATKVLNDE